MCISRHFYLIPRFTVNFGRGKKVRYIGVILNAAVYTNSHIRLEFGERVRHDKYKGETVNRGTVNRGTTDKDPTTHKQNELNSPHSPMSIISVVGEAKDLRTAIVT